MLADDPYPSQDTDKDLIKRSRISAYRLQVARAYIIFYRINDKEVKILKITTIEQAHKMYGQLDF